MKRKSEVDIWNVNTITNDFDLKKLKIVSPDEQVSCEVYLFGATVTSYIVNNEEKLFLSSKAILNGSKAIRGGIPIVFPQFGQPLTSMSQHGFARLSYWTHLSTQSTSDNAVVELGLESNETTMKVWPHTFSLKYIITVTMESLSCRLVIQNSGETSFRCIVYFRIVLNCYMITFLI
jgi:glucose-6-phosphate 1-epimerase